MWNRVIATGINVLQNGYLWKKFTRNIRFIFSMGQRSLLWSLLFHLFIIFWVIGFWGTVVQFGAIRLTPLQNEWSQASQGLRKSLVVNMLTNLAFLVDELKVELIGKLSSGMWFHWEMLYSQNENFNRNVLIWMKFHFENKRNSVSEWNVLIFHLFVLKFKFIFLNQNWNTFQFLSKQRVFPLT